MGDNLIINKKFNKVVLMESLILCGRERVWFLVLIMYFDDFWVWYFEGYNFVLWKCFCLVFLEDYGVVIYDFVLKRIYWILFIVYMDIFVVIDDIYKLYYDKFCGRFEYLDCFWFKIKEYVFERIFCEGVIEFMFEQNGLG